MEIRHITLALHLNIMMILWNILFGWTYSPVEQKYFFRYSATMVRYGYNSMITKCITQRLF